MPAGALSQLILDLHSGGAAAPLSFCKEALLTSLRRSIPFDSAIWGTGSEAPQLIFGIATVEFPLERLTCSPGM
jgi:hypothetical protein